MAWHSPGFDYRQPVTVTNGGGSDLESYAFRFSLDHAALVTAGKANADGSDLRFTEDERGPLLPHWIESGLNTSTCFIWVKLNLLESGVTDVVYMYYGNASAPDVSSGENTFLFFDDFSTEDNTKWTYGEAYGGYAAMPYAISGGQLRIYKDTAGWGILRMRRTWTSEDNIIVRTRFKTAATSNWLHSILVEKNNTNRNRFGLVDDATTSPIQYRHQKIDNSTVSYSWDLAAITADQWYQTEVMKQSTTDMYAKLLGDDGSLLDATATSSTNWSSLHWVWVTWLDSNVNCYYDWIAVRKYGTDPSVDFGDEESRVDLVKLWGLRITKPGIGLDEAELEDYVLDTTQNRLKIYMKGSGTFVIPPDETGDCGGVESFSVYHGLDYVPMVWFFAEENTTGKWHQAPTLVRDLVISATRWRDGAPDYQTDVRRYKFWIGRPNPVFYGNDISNIAYIKYKYFIFLDPAVDAWYE